MRSPFRFATALTRPALAIVGGTLLGVILQEAVWNLLNALVWATDLYDALLVGPAREGLLWALIASWIAGGAAAGLMSTLIAGHRAAGYVSGALMTGSAALMIAMAWPDAGTMLLLALTPALAAAAGAWLGQPLVTADRKPAANLTSTTPTAHELD